MSRKVMASIKPSLREPGALSLRALDGRSSTLKRSLVEADFEEGDLVVIIDAADYERLLAGAK